MNYHKGDEYIRGNIDFLDWLFDHHEEDHFEEVKENKRWRAEIDTSYFYISSWGKVDSTVDMSSDFDNWQYDHGNYYETKKIAEAYLERQKFLNEFRAFVEEENENTKRGVNYFTIYGTPGYRLEVSTHDINFNYLDVFKFRTRESAKKAISKFGDKLFILDPMWKPDNENSDRH